MFRVDVLSAYLNCGVSALVGSAMLRIVETEDARLRQALRICGWALVMLCLGLLSAALGEGAAHPLAQFSLSFGSLAALVLMSHGLGQVLGRDIPLPVLSALIAGLMLAVVAAMAAGPLVFGQVYALCLAGTGTLMAWHARGFVSSPRNRIERGLGLSLVLVAASSWLRLGFTISHVGAPRTDMLYGPAQLEPLLAALYGVIPIVMATLLLSLVNARLHQQLRSRAATDKLTGLLSRRALRELAPPMIELEQQRRRDMAVLMLDIDHFKSINDNHGHVRVAGDKILRWIATSLQSNLRHDALLARYGGEEFVVVLPVDDLPGARRASERLRPAVEDIDWARSLGLDLHATVSVGVALMGPHERLDGALQRADEALYRAKREGRNQVQISLMVA